LVPQAANGQTTNETNEAKTTTLKESTTAKAAAKSTKSLATEVNQGDNTLLWTLVAAALIAILAYGITVFGLKKAKK
jgi:hypothetical protein